MVRKNERYAIAGERMDAVRGQKWGARPCGGAPLFRVLIQGAAAVIRGFRHEQTNRAQPDGMVRA